MCYWLISGKDSHFIPINTHFVHDFPGRPHQYHIRGSTAISFPVFSFPAGDAALEVVVLDGGVGLFHAALEFAEAEGHTEFEIASVLCVDDIFPAQDIALGGARLVVHVLVERSACQQAHGETVLAQEGALQGERIAVPRFAVRIKIHTAVSDLAEDVARQL